MNTTAKANRQYFLIKKYPSIAKQKQNDFSVTSESAQAIKGGQNGSKGAVIHAHRRPGASRTRLVNWILE